MSYFGRILLKKDNIRYDSDIVVGAVWRIIQEQYIIVYTQNTTRLWKRNDNMRRNETCIIKSNIMITVMTIS